MELSSPSVQMWVPEESSISSSRLTAFMLHCARLTGQNFPDQAAFQRFTVSQFRDFWRLLLDWAKLPVEGDAEPISTHDACETASFFPNLRLNYAEALLDGNDAAPAITACHDSAPAHRLSRAELRGQVARAAASLQELLEFCPVCGPRALAFLAESSKDFEALTFAVLLAGLELRR